MFTIMKSKLKNWSRDIESGIFMIIMFVFERAIYDPIAFAICKNQYSYFSMNSESVFKYC